jgi:hypothetical protein
MELPASFGNLELVWQSFKIHMDDNSTSLSISAAFENYSPFSLAHIDKIEYFIALEKTNIMKIILKRIGVERFSNI